MSRLNRRIGEQRLELGSKPQPPAGFRIQQRLLAEPIARQHQPLAAIVPQREREHAVELAHELVAQLLVEMHEDLGVALRREACGRRASSRSRSSWKL